MKENGEKLNTVKLEKRKKLKNNVLYWVILNAGVLMYAVGVFLFKGPNNFATGGVSGIAIIIARYTQDAVPFLTQSVLNIILNVLLLRGNSEHRAVHKSGPVKSQ